MCVRDLSSCNDMIEVSRSDRVAIKKGLVAALGVLWYALVTAGFGTGTPEGVSPLMLVLSYSAVFVIGVVPPAVAYWLIFKRPAPWSER